MEHYHQPEQNILKKKIYENNPPYRWQWFHREIPDRYEVPTSSAVQMIFMINPGVNILENNFIINL